MYVMVSPSFVGFHVSQSSLWSTLEVYLCAFVVWLVLGLVCIFAIPGLCVVTAGYQNRVDVPQHMSPPRDNTQTFVRTRGGGDSTPPPPRGIGGAMSPDVKASGYG